MACKVMAFTVPPHGEHKFGALLPVLLIPTVAHTVTDWACDSATIVAEVVNGPHTVRTVVGAPLHASGPPPVKPLDPQLQPGGDVRESLANAIAAVSSSPIPNVQVLLDMHIPIATRTK